MAKARVVEELPVAADLLWRRIRDFGDVSWLQGVSKVEVEGEGPGMVRALYAGDGPPVRERLESVDDATRTLRYSIPEGIPFPVKDYRATMRVADAGADRSRLEWVCECEPAGAPEGQAVAAIEGMYGVLIGWLRQSLRADS